MPRARRTRANARGLECRDVNRDTRPGLSFTGRRRPSRPMCNNTGDCESSPQCSPPDREPVVHGDVANGSSGGEAAFHTRPLVLRPKLAPVSAPVDPRLYDPEQQRANPGVNNPDNAGDGAGDESDYNNAEREKHD